MIYIKCTHCLLVIGHQNEAAVVHGTRKKPYRQLLPDPTMFSISVGQTGRQTYASLAAPPSLCVKFPNPRNCSNAQG